MITIDNKKPPGRCPTCMTLSLYERIADEYDKYSCRGCGSGCSEKELKKANSRKSSEELQLAITHIRWGEHANSRNPHYHASLDNSQARLKRAVNSAIKALEEKGM